MSFCTEKHRICRDEKLEHHDDVCPAVYVLEGMIRYCTREKNHYGDHVACGFECHNIIIWNRAGKILEPHDDSETEFEMIQIEKEITEIVKRHAGAATDEDHLAMGSEHFAYLENRQTKKLLREEF